MKKILIVDDELGTRESLRTIFKKDYEVHTASSGEEALEAVREDNLDLVLLDILMPRMDGIEVLQRIKEVNSCHVIMLTAMRNVKTAVNAMKMGAFDYIVKPFNVDEIKMVVEKALSTRDLMREVEYLRSELDKSYNFANILGTTEAMRKVFHVIRQAADTRSTVLVSGESGTGKELVARAIHYNGPRRNKPFVAINCAAIPESLMESELFGHERGSFTSAHARKAGQIEQASEGTLFLDEITELSPYTQAKILRFLQEKEINRVGGARPIKVDTRVIAATNKNPEKALEEGTLRDDLYYRINIIPIALPPLRERKDDIPLLVGYFLKKMSTQESKRAPSVTSEALDLLVQYHWPGNVRELENLIERAFILTRGDKIVPDDIAPHLKPSIKHKVLSGALSLDKAEEEFERDVILEALNKSNHVQTRAAQLLGVSRRILKYKMDKWGIS
jgi:DNA-binding NtrC family response regulator